MSPVVLVGTEIVNGEFPDVMLHRHNVVRHVTRMTDLTRPPTTDTQTHNTETDRYRPRQIQTDTETDRYKQTDNY